MRSRRRCLVLSVQHRAASPSEARSLVFPPNRRAGGRDEWGLAADSEQPVDACRWIAVIGTMLGAFMAVLDIKSPISPSLIRSRSAPAPRGRDHPVRKQRRRPRTRHARAREDFIMAFNDAFLTVAISLILGTGVVWLCKTRPSRSPHRRLAISPVGTISHIPPSYSHPASHPRIY